MTAAQAGRPASTTSGFGPAHHAQVRRALQVARTHTPGDGTDLAGWLYTRWYAAAWAGPAADDGGMLLGAAMPGILTSAHAGSDRWQEGATVMSTGQAGAVVVRTDEGRIRALGRGDYLCPPGLQGLAPTTGAALRIRERQGCVVADGWWRTWGGVRQASTTGAVSRIYLAPDRDQVARLVGVVTDQLSGAAHAWTLKVGVDPLTLARPDGAVVYVPDGALQACLRRLAPAVAGLLHAHVPPLTCVVAPGLAWSHDPGDGQSFGEHRCWVLAEACTTAMGPQATPDDVAAAFRGAGLDPAAPHLRATTAAARW